MRVIMLKGLVGILVLACIEFVVPACNTTKATAEEQDQFKARVQSNYSVLLAPDRRTAESMQGILITMRQDLRADSRLVE